jgi:hypothetical protein
MDAYWQDKAAKLESITISTYAVADVVTDLHRMGTFKGYRRLGSKDKWLRKKRTCSNSLTNFLRGANNGRHDPPMWDGRSGSWR